MKKTAKYITRLCIVAIFLSVGTYAFAAPSSWTVQPDTSLLNNQITSLTMTNSGSVIDFTMTLLAGAPAVNGKTYSVYFANAKDVFNDSVYFQYIDTSINKAGTKATGTLNTDVATVLLSPVMDKAKTTLSWSVNRADMLYDNFYFGGLITTTANNVTTQIGRTEIVSANITQTPIPGAAWLLTSGLVGIVGVRRMKRV